MSKETTNRSFDELARAVAEGSLSRRRALKLFAGTAIAALIPSRALADGRKGRRKNHDDDDDHHHDDDDHDDHHDDDDKCFVRICHVPFNHETGKCDFANAETLFVTKRERRRHLKNHHCDFRGRCTRRTTSTTTTLLGGTTSTTTTPFGGTTSTTTTP